MSETILYHKRLVVGKIDKNNVYLEVTIKEHNQKTKRQHKTKIKSK